MATSCRPGRARPLRLRSRVEAGRRHRPHLHESDLDGENVVNISYAAARNLGFTQSNPYGLVLLQTRPIDNLTIGYPAPLNLERELLLSVQVNEPNVAQILANVIHGTP